MSDIMISYFSFDGEQHLNSIIGRKWFFFRAIIICFGKKTKLTFLNRSTHWLCRWNTAEDNRWWSDGRSISKEGTRSAIRPNETSKCCLQLARKLWRRWL